MTRRYLIFERPVGSKCWTQTLDKGKTRCVGFPTLHAADAAVQKQLARNDEWEYCVRSVFLPK